MACGGTSTGYLSWFIYNTSSNSWTGTAKKVALNGTYRKCYLMSYPDGKNGLYIVGDVMCFCQLSALRERSQAPITHETR